ncbi:MAG: T9SS type A sorting domain-containing protein [Bacteroidota bacterium]
MRLALLVLSSLSALSLFAQITVSTGIIPAVGDTLFSSGAEAGQTVDLIDTGGPHDWDFSNIVEGGSRERLVEALDLNTQDSIFAEADAKISFGDGTFNYYRLLPDRMELVGNIGSLEFIPGFEVATPFSPVYIDRRAPFDFIDQFSNEANILLTFPVEDLPEDIIILGGDFLEAVDSVRLNTAIEQDDIIDAYGTLTVDGITYDVLREKRTEVRTLAVEAYNQLFGWQDATAAFLLVINGLPGGEEVTGIDTLITYNFWPESGPVPAATVVTNTQGEIESINYRTNLGGPSSTEEGELMGAEISMYPNPVQRWVTFEANNVPSADYSLHIHNGLGQQMMVERFPNTNRIFYQADLSFLPRGLYYYSLRNSRGRILTTKRLLVGGYRP